MILLRLEVDGVEVTWAQLPSSQSPTIVRPKDIEELARFIVDGLVAGAVRDSVAKSTGGDAS